MISRAPEVNEKVNELRHKARSRWGQCKLTVEISLWENDEFSVTVFHTESVHEGIQSTKSLRHQLKYKSHTDEITEEESLVEERKVQVLEERVIDE